MAQAIFIRQTRQSGAHGYKNDDPCDIVADAVDLGDMVDPDRNPSGGYQIVDVTSTLPSAIKWSLESEYGPEDGRGNRPLLRKRLFKMNVNMLPVPLRPPYSQGIRISLTEAEYTAAVLLK